MIIAYSITWSVSLGLYFLYRQHTISFSALNIYYTLGCLGPFLSAIITTQRYYGKQGIRKLLASLRVKQTGYKPWLLSLSPLLFFIVGYFLYPLLSGKWFSFAITQREFKLTGTASYFGWALPFIAYGLFEELGWRGFALPHLQEKFSAFKSSVILSSFWAVWHLPFFLWRLHFSIAISIGFFAGIFVATIILTSIFNFSKGSVLPCMIFHLTNNIASAFDKKYIVAALSTGFVLLAIWILIKYKSRIFKNLAMKYFFLFFSLMLIQSAGNCQADTIPDNDHKTFRFCTNVGPVELTFDKNKVTGWYILTVTPEKKKGSIRGVFNKGLVHADWNDPDGQGPDYFWFRSGLNTVYCDLQQG